MLIELPTQQDLDAAAAAFDRDWGAVDEILYGICNRWPAHRERRCVTAKVVLIGRAYSAGLERHVEPDDGGQAITRIASFLCTNAHCVDDIIAQLGILTEPLDANAMTAIVAQHGQFSELLRRLTTAGAAPRSFVAKYLHFHHPIVPLYDSYAAASLAKLVPWDAAEIPFPLQSGADREYWDFCTRFLRLYQACRDADLAVTVRGLDTFLWQVPQVAPSKTKVTDAADSAAAGGGQP
jgi:hypothetical protein